MLQQNLMVMQGLYTYEKLFNSLNINCSGRIIIGRKYCYLGGKNIVLTIAYVTFFIIFYGEKDLWLNLKSKHLKAYFRI